MPKSDQVLLDLNNPVFQEDLFSLGKEEASRVFLALRKLKRLSWSEVHKDKGLRWELVQSKRGPGGMRLYTIRITDKVSVPWFAETTSSCVFFRFTATMTPPTGKLAGRPHHPVP